jgi:hypothetical protein
MNIPTLFTPVRPHAIEAPNRLALAPLAMESTVAALIAPGKGILAADESFPTIEKRFKSGFPIGESFFSQLSMNKTLE